MNRTTRITAAVVGIHLESGRRVLSAECVMCEVLDVLLRE